MPGVSWAEAKERMGCHCERSDAWRCAAMARRTDVLACSCQCHQYVTMRMAPITDREEETLP